MVVKCSYLAHILVVGIIFFNEIHVWILAHSLSAKLAWRRKRALHSWGTMSYLTGVQWVNCVSVCPAQSSVAKTLHDCADVLLGTLHAVSVQMVQAILDYGGRKARGSDLFGNQDPVAITKRLLKGLKVVCVLQVPLSQSGKMCVCVWGCECSVVDS